jgi:hypothetical protein
MFLHPIIFTVPHQDNCCHARNDNTLADSTKKANNQPAKYRVTIQGIPKTNRKAHKERKELRKIRPFFNSLSCSQPKTNPDLNSYNTVTHSTINHGACVTAVTEAHPLAWSNPAAAR